MKFQQAKHFRKDKREPGDVLMVVIHAMQFPERDNAAEWCSSFFTDPRGPKGPVVASAHYAVDNDSITQCVLEKDIAYHTPGAIGGRFVNDFSIGIEHAGYAEQSAEGWSDAYSTAMLERSAELVAEICRRHSIPVRRLTVEDLKLGNVHGITGHDACTKATGTGSHWDPGPHFPWAWFLERVQSHTEVALREPSVLPPSIVTAAPVLDFSSFVSVECDGVTWLVAPVYIAPVGIGQAAALAEKLGCELPTPALVDAIWRASDLKVPPHLMVRAHDGTVAQMDSMAIHAKQVEALETFVGSRGLGNDFHLIGGAFKDVIRQASPNGKLGLYGWHADEEGAAELAKKQIPTHAPVSGGPGVVIQQPFYGHAAGWRDYSQGLRLVKRA